MRRGTKREVPGEVVDELMDEVARRLTNRLAEDLRRMARFVQQGRLDALPKRKRPQKPKVKRRSAPVEPFRLVAH